MGAERRLHQPQDAVQGGDIVPVLHGADGGFRHPVAQHIARIDAGKAARIFILGADAVTRKPALRFPAGVAEQGDEITVLTGKNAY